MKFFAAYVSIVIFAFLSLIHVYWGVGGRWGYDVAIPVQNGKPAFNPSKGVTILLAIILALPILLILGRMEVFATKLPSWFFQAGLWGICFVFLLRAIGNFKTIGFFKKRTGTKFSLWDTFLFSPLCLLVSFLILFVSISNFSTWA